MIYTHVILVYCWSKYICSMKTPDSKLPRKPLLSIECENEDQKAHFGRIAKARGVSMAALVRLLLLDEGRRLGVS